MRKLAVPFVMTFSGGLGCASSPPPPPEPTHAPASTPPAHPLCATTVDEGKACEREGELCAPADRRLICGDETAYECRDGKWLYRHSMCNPPEAFTD